MAQYAMLSIGRNGEYEACDTFEQAKQAASDYYRMQGQDAEETVICLSEGSKLLKSWEKNSKSNWVRITDEKYLERLTRRLIQPA